MVRLPNTLSKCGITGTVLARKTCVSYRLQLVRTTGHDCVSSRHVVEVKLRSYDL